MKKRPYTEIPNEIIAAMPIMHEPEIKVTVAILRLTHGYHVPECQVSYDTLVKMTGLSRGGVASGVAAASARGFFERFGRSGWRSLVYGVDQNGSNDSLTDGLEQSTSQTENSLPGRLSHRSTLKKEKGKKRERKEAPSPAENPNHPQWTMPPALDTPEFEQAWINWFKHLHEKSKPMTQTAGDLELERLAAMGLERALAAINYSIRRRAVNIYEPDSTGSSTGADTLTAVWREVKAQAANGNTPRFSSDKIFEAVSPIWPEVKAMTDFNEREIRAKFERNYHAVT